MSNTIPPLLRNSPPPLSANLDDEDDDDFGDFAVAADTPYGCDDGLSLPSSPLGIPIQSDSPDVIVQEHKKDFQDKRKDSGGDSNDQIQSKNFVNNVHVNNDDEYFPYFADEPPNLKCNDNNDEVELRKDNKQAQVCIPTSKSIERDKNDVSDGAVSQNFEEVSPKPEQRDVQAEYDHCPDESQQESMFSTGEDLSDDFGDFEDAVVSDSLKISEDFNTDSKSIEEQQETEAIGGDAPLCVSPMDGFIKDDNDNLTKGDGDFNAFENAPQEGEIIFEANFDDFSGQTSETTQKTETDDEFGEFNNFSEEVQPTFEMSKDELGLLSNLDMKVAFDKCEELVLKMFPSVINSSQNEEISETEIQCNFVIGNGVFSQVKDVTDTYALSYQWSKSNSQKFLLKALNIDSRNILYGPRWNESIPRYAANLGYQPLEPVKSSDTILEPSKSSQQSMNQNPSSTLTAQTDIPLAQFDWVSSGLTNPLENSTASTTMLLDLEQLVASLDIEYSSSGVSKQINASSSPVNDNDEWEFWLSSNENVSKENTNLGLPKLPNPSENSSDDCVSNVEETVEQTQTHLDSDSVKSLQLSPSELPTEETTSKDLADPSEEFTEWQSTVIENERKNTACTMWADRGAPSSISFPLRETHITSTGSIPPSNSKDIVFQENSWLKPVETVGVTVMHNCPQQESSLSYSDFLKPSSVKPVLNEIQIDSEKEEKNCNDEDEFTDFQSILPVSNAKTMAPQTVSDAEILQPTKAFESVLQPTVLSNALPTTINWPDPGVTDDDLQQINFNYLVRPADQANIENESVHNSADNYEVSIKNEILNTNQKDDDEDEWSDFVSIQTAPVISNTLNLCSTKPVQSLINSTQTSGVAPDYVANNSCSVNKDLFKTFIPPNLQFKNTVLVEKQSVQSTETYLQSTTQLPLNGTVNFNKPLVPAPAQLAVSQQNSSTTPNNSFTSSTNDGTDDEWSDFVFSQPAAPSSVSQISKPKINFDWNKPPQFTSWSASIQPNIITNPVSVDAYQKYSTPTAQSDLFKASKTTGPKKAPNVVLQPNKGPIQSISSVPELEFIGSKSKTWKK